jgi:hypothetical protein
MIRPKARRRFAAVMMLLSLVTNACRDLPTFNDQQQATILDNGGPNGLQPELDKKGGSEPILSAYGCTVIQRAGPAGSGYQVIRRSLIFKKNALEVNGETLVYRYFEGAPGEEPAAAFACVIPNTEKAVKAMEQLLQIKVKHKETTERKQPVIAQEYLGGKGFSATLAPTAGPRFDTYYGGMIAGIVVWGHSDFWQYIDANLPLDVDIGSLEVYYAPGGSAPTNYTGSWDSVPVYAVDDANNAGIIGMAMFAGCVGFSLLTMGTISIWKFQSDQVYIARENWEGSKRQLDAMRENNVDEATIMMWEWQTQNYANQFEDAKTNLAAATGATAVSVGAAVVACLPRLMFPL